MSATRPTPETAAIFDAYARCACGTADIRLKMEKLERERDELTNKMVANEAYQSGLLADIEVMRETMREAAGILAQIPVAYDHRFFRAGQWANAALAKLQPHLHP